MDAVRTGYITARSQKAYDAWRSRNRKPLSGDALETAILNLGRMFPGQVTRVSA